MNSYHLLFLSYFSYFKHFGDFYGFHSLYKTKNFLTSKVEVWKFCLWSFTWLLHSSLHYPCIVPFSVSFNKLILFSIFFSPSSSQSQFALCLLPWLQEPSTLKTAIMRENGMKITYKKTHLAKWTQWCNFKFSWLKIIWVKCEKAHARKRTQLYFLWIHVLGWENSSMCISQQTTGIFSWHWRRG